MMIAQYLERMKKVVVCVSSPIQLKLKVLQYIGCTKNTYGINLNLKPYIKDLFFFFFLVFSPAQNTLITLPSIAFLFVTIFFSLFIDLLFFIFFLSISFSLSIAFAHYCFFISIYLSFFFLKFFCRSFLYDCFPLLFLLFFILTILKKAKKTIHIIICNSDVLLRVL